MSGVFSQLSLPPPPAEVLTRQFILDWIFFLISSACKNKAVVCLVRVVGPQRRATGCRFKAWSGGGGGALLLLCVLPCSQQTV